MIPSSSLVSHGFSPLPCVPWLPMSLQCFMAPPFLFLFSRGFIGVPPYQYLMCSIVPLTPWYSIIVPVSVLPPWPTPPGASMGKGKSRHRGVYTCRFAAPQLLLNIPSADISAVIFACLSSYGRRLPSYSLFFPLIFACERNREFIPQSVGECFS